MIVVNICLTICTEQMSVMILVENLIGEITFDTLDPPGAQFVESPFGHIFLFAEYTHSLGNLCVVHTLSSLTKEQLDKNSPLNPFLSPNFS